MCVPLALLSVAWFAGPVYSEFGFRCICLASKEFESIGHPLPTERRKKSSLVYCWICELIFGVQIFNLSLCFWGFVFRFKYCCIFVPGYASLPLMWVDIYRYIYAHADMHACTHAHAYIHSLSLMIMTVIIFASPSFTMPWPVSTERTSVGGFCKQYVKWQSFIHSHIWKVHSESAWEQKTVPHVGSRWPAIPRISFSFCWKVGVCGECVVTLPLAVNEH